MVRCISGDAICIGEILVPGMSEDDIRYCLDHGYYFDDTEGEATEYYFTTLSVDEDDLNFSLIEIKSVNTD